MGLFKKKPGGTKVGNFLRGVVNSKLGINLQPPIPLEVPQASVIPTGGIVKNPSVTGVVDNLFSGIKDTINNVTGGIESASKTPKKVNTLLTVGIIAVVVMVLSNLSKSRR